LKALRHLSSVEIKLSGGDRCAKKKTLIDYETNIDMPNAQIRIGSSTLSRPTVIPSTNSSTNSQESSNERPGSFRRGLTPSVTGSAQAKRLRSNNPLRFISKSLEFLLKGLKVRTEKLAEQMDLNNAYVSENEVEHNATNIRCPKENIVTVTPWRTDPDPINSNLHANKITFKSVSGQENGNAYISAQSPIPKKNNADSFFACDKFLTAAIESKSGLFQFVSPSKIKDEDYISKRSIIGQLMHAFETSGNDLLIGGRYQVKNIIPMDRSNDAGNDISDKSHFMLVVEGIKPNSTEKFRTSIVLTQARMEFKNKLLSTEGIKAASALMDEHNYRAAQKATNRPDPMIVSHAGIGRNATLIVYREMLGRILNGTITDTNQLEKEVINLIEQGRIVRGPQFVHSDEQIGELVKALQEELPNKKSLVTPHVNQQPEVPANNPPVEEEKEPLDNAAPMPSPSEARARYK
jgi:hypothetical protein